jgi:hypothetical protein
MNMTTSKEEINDNQSKKTIIKNPNFVLTRNKKNHYQIDFTVENKNIYVSNILNFSFIKLIYEVNKNMFEIVQLDMINENEAKLYLLMKPIMKDLGVFQRFSTLKITMYSNAKSVYFKGIPCPEYISLNKCKNAILAPIKEFTIMCNILTPHKFTITKTLVFDSDFTMILFFENIFGTLIKNIFQQTIKAIECIK